MAAACPFAIAVREAASSVFSERALFAMQEIAEGDANVCARPQCCEDHIPYVDCNHAGLRKNTSQQRKTYVTSSLLRGSQQGWGVSDRLEGNLEFV